MAVSLPLTATAAVKPRQGTRSLRLCAALVNACVTCHILRELQSTNCMHYDAAKCMQDSNGTYIGQRMSVHVLILELLLLVTLFAEPFKIALLSAMIISAVAMPLSPQSEAVHMHYKYRE
eukprot:1904-Heterococcus_DN1.PRE.9